MHCYASQTFSVSKIGREDSKLTSVYFILDRFSRILDKFQFNFQRAFELCTIVYKIKRVQTIMGQVGKNKEAERTKEK